MDENACMDMINSSDSGAMMDTDAEQRMFIKTSDPRLAHGLMHRSKLPGNIYKALTIQESKLMELGDCEQCPAL